VRIVDRINDSNACYLLLKVDGERYLVRIKKEKCILYLALCGLTVETVILWD